MMRIPRSYLIHASAAVLAAGLAHPAAAQGVSKGAQAPAADAPVAGIGAEDIVVTARQRSERLIDVPVAVTAVSPAQLQRYSLTTLSAISSQVPQLIVGEGQTAAGGDLVLRGIGAGYNPAADQPTSLNIDGVQFSRAGPLRLGQLDLNRVEVLKGPQALFFGKNSPAGVISLLSNNPTADFSVQLRTGYEFANKQKFVEPIVNIPITPEFGIRIAAYASDQVGWFRNQAQPIVGATATTSSPGGTQATTPDQRELFGRITLAYASPDGKISVNLKTSGGSTHRKSGVGGFSQYYYCPIPSLLNQSSCTLDRNYFEPNLRPADAALRPQDYGDGTPKLSANQFLTALTINAALADWLNLTSVSGYYRYKEDGRGALNGDIPNLATRSVVDSKQYTQEVRLQSDSSGPFNFLLGAYYQSASFRNYQPTFFAGVGILPVNDYDMRTTAWSGFGQLRYKPFDKLELSVGGRYSNEEKTLGGTRTPNGGAPSGIIVARPKRKFDNFSPEVTLTYKPTTSITAYASYREGFTSGGYNTLGSTTPTPQTDLSYDQMTAAGEEAGIKGYIAERQIRFDLTAYRYKYDGLQLVALRFINGIITSQTVNAGSASIRGVELNLTATPRALPGLELRTALSYNHARYTDFLGTCYPGQGVSEGCNLLPKIADGVGANAPGAAANPYQLQNQNGRPLYRAPDWALNAGISYDLKVGKNLGTIISIDGKYTSSYFTDVGNDPNGRMPKVLFLDASISLYSGENHDWEVALIGRNLTQKFRVLDTIAAEPVGTGTTGFSAANLYGAINQPRTILLQLKLKSSALGF